MFYESRDMEFTKLDHELHDDFKHLDEMAMKEHLDNYLSEDRTRMHQQGRIFTTMGNIMYWTHLNQHSDDRMGN